MSESARVLIVDDEDLVRQSLVRVLRQQAYECTATADAQEARAVLRRDVFDVMLCDVNMPGESGLDLVRYVLGAYPDMAVVMVTGMDEPAFARLAIDAGAYGYVVKPFTPNEILISIASALARQRLESESRAQKESLAQTVRERTDELWASVKHLDKADAKVNASVEEMVRRLSMIAELRDQETATHIERMSRYAEILARRLGLDAERCSQIRLASRLHDAGKMALPDRILRKRGPFTEADQDIMKSHTEAGYRLFSGSGAGLLQMAATIAYTHHERWDGTGYPRGLAGEDIPLEGRITAVADVFDAMLSKRSYKPAFPLGRVVEEMRAAAGSHFEPTLIETFLDALDEVLVVTEMRIE